MGSALPIRRYQVRADREDLPIGNENGRRGTVDDRRATYVIIAAAAAVIVGLLLYMGMRDPAEPEVAAPQQVIRDNELVAPPAVNTAAAPATTPGAAGETANFNQRQLPPPVATVGAGEAPAPATALDAEGEPIVIDGVLLEEIEEDAATPAPAQ
jgi:hypothetical protein